MADEPEIWLTYDEAAERLRIKPDSVRRRAASRKWPRRQGNDGKARVRIPPEAVPDVTPDDTPDLTPDTSEELIRARLENAGLKAELSGVRERLSDTQAERDRLARLLEEALKPRTGLIERIGRAFRNT
jgi:hypothetical protein